MRSPTRTIQIRSGKKEPSNRSGFISATGKYVSDAQLAREIDAAHRGFFAKREGAQAKHVNP